MPAIKWITSGLATMVQGIPFRGQRHHGMPLAGAADPVALALANWLAGNAHDTTAVETAYAPISFQIIAQASEKLALGIHGAATSVKLNGVIISCDRTIIAQGGDILEIPAPKYGCRSYIAIHGGFPAKSVMGATSSYLPANIGGTISGPIIAGAITNIDNHANGQLIVEPHILPNEYKLAMRDQFIMRFVEGSEYHWLSNDAQECLGNVKWRISQRSNRMGMQMDGTTLSLSRQDALQSSAVFNGSIQCPPSGEPFLLGPDAQTTGGYPRIAQIIRADRHLIGQLRPDARISLQKIKPEEARRLYRSKISLLQKIQPDIRLD